MSDSDTVCFLRFHSLFIKNLSYGINNEACPDALSQRSNPFEYINLTGIPYGMPVKSVFVYNIYVTARHRHTRKNAVLSLCCKLPIYSLFKLGTSKYSACGEWQENFSSVYTKFCTHSCLYVKKFCDEWRKYCPSTFVRWIFRGSLN